MERQPDRHIQRLLQTAASYDNPYRHSIEYQQDERDPSEWRFAPGPGQRKLAHGSVNIRETYGLDVADRSQLPPASSTGRTRLSLAPPSMYNQPEREPRMITNADNHFRFTQNLRNGVSLSQALPRQFSMQSTDPISPLATAMLTQQPMSLRQAQPAQSINWDLQLIQRPARREIVRPTEPLGLSPTDILAQNCTLQRQPHSDNADIFQGLPDSRLKQLQPQKQQVTPPFNLNGFIRSPQARQAPYSSSPLAGQGSSPTARVSLRRTSNRTVPTLECFNVDIGADREQNIDVPQTPQRQATYPIPRSAPRTLALSHAPPMAHGINLISPHDLPDRLRQVFPYQLFNAVQSKCFAPIYNTNDNVVVSAPTGSGKTVLLELAICRAVTVFGTGEFKIVYQAPTKSLCSERVRDWGAKFSHLNLSCAELTGDTSQAEMARVRNASIIVTTPEKWDSITRRWSDHQKLVQMVKLFLIDEVHILRDARGATLEAVVSRMKTMGANVRFVALSATVPNSEDIAVWLGRDHTNHQIPAHRETFGEDFRPIKLQKFVHGYDGNFNQFAFEKSLDGKLPALLRQYSQKKPIMVFCFTRKSCETTASMLAEWWSGQGPTDRAWPAPLKNVVVHDKCLQSLVSSGVSYHHAGLDPQDRTAIETGFLKGNINVVCCTSTLAVGVNLPCHTVVLKGTLGYQGGHLLELSDLEVMQMLGRAGRPQFDNSAVAVIMTRNDKVDHYKKMVSGQDILESTLHLNLIEHLNSEISLGTIRNIYDAKRWLCGTFLSVRMRQNPTYYKVEGISQGGDADGRLEQVCDRDITLLQQHRLISDEERICCTEYGAAMSRYMVRFETMKLLLTIPDRASTEQILRTICQASEFKDLRMKPNERPVLREFNKSPFLKYPIREAVTTTPHKVLLLIQIQLGGIEDPAEKDFAILRRQFGLEKNLIFERIQRLMHCVIDCKAYDCDSISTRHALDLARSISAGFWEYSNLQLRQIPQVGPVATRKLVSNNVQTIDELGKMDTATIERHMSKNPPFGRNTRESISGFPRLKIASELVSRVTAKSKGLPKVQVKAHLSFENEKIPVWKSRKPSVTFMAETTDGKLVHFWRGNVSKLATGFDAKFTAEISAHDVDIKCWIACEDIVGTVKSYLLKHNIPASDFPLTSPFATPKTDGKTHMRQNSINDSDEFGSDEIEDRDLIDAAEGVEIAKVEYDSDDFVDIDNATLGFTRHAKKFEEIDETRAKKAKEVEILESFQMANGRWTCNHSCRDGQLLKNGKPCKHVCCRDGIDKPRRLKRKQTLGTNVQSGEGTSTDDGKPGGKVSAASRAIQKSQPKFKLSKYRDENVEDAELVDLSNELSPVPYANLAPRDYRKLHKLHTSVQTDRPSQRLIQKPLFSYASGMEPDISFLTEKNTGEISESDEYGDEPDFPSPTDLLATDDDLFEDDPHDFGLHAPLASITRDATGTGPAATSSYQDGSIESLEAGMMELEDPVMARLATPTLKSSFGNEMFDFDAFEDDNEEMSPDFKGSSKEERSTPVVSTLSSARKRPFANSPDEAESKQRRVADEESDIKLSSCPKWVSEFDNDLISGLMDIVEFID
ncbi:related to ATP-dependent DNA helicase [Rhynchosporium agropyri]|uniref:DNA 3'-5' helicase n=1 Tax=Rhynchosporium agropyri TaxID=914238 RepID=A0A1E1KD26_9HELO|nr:related to ATP-dependent DNA helicase [Rhynchosporium agropyri]